MKLEWAQGEMERITNIIQMDRWLKENQRSALDYSMVQHVSVERNYLWATRESQNYLSLI